MKHALFLFLSLGISSSIHCMAPEYPVIPIYTSSSPIYIKKPKSPYIFRSNEEAISRLVYENQTNFAKTQAFIENVHAKFPIAPNAEIIGIGSGTAYPEQWMAEHLVPEGNVLITDICVPLLNYAQAVSEAHKIKNVTFGTLDAQRMYLNPEFDVAYLRNLLPHVSHPRTALLNICRALKPGKIVNPGGLFFDGGTLMIQEESFCEMELTPPLPIIDYIIKQAKEISSTRGVDYDIGPKLFQLVSEIPFMKVQLSNRYTSTLDSNKTLLYHTVREATEKLAQEGYNLPRRSKVLDSLARIADSKKYKVTTTTYQICATKII